MNVFCALQRSLITLVITTCMLASVHGQELSFTLHEQFVIGDDAEAPAEYIFSYPQQVRTDSKGNIYVHDRRRLDVRVFDASGRYVTTVGKRGEGPGEMRDIVGVHVDDQDRLIVADRIGRRFTIFTDMGTGFETKAIAEKRTISPEPILSLEDAFVLRYVKPIDDPEGGGGIRDDKVLHLYDTELNWLEEFAPLADIFNLDRPFLNAHSGTPLALKVATNGTDTIILAPTVYDGYIYRYTRSNDVWILERLEGGSVSGRAYIPVTKKEQEANKDLSRSSISISGPTGPHRARVINWSRGVTILNTGEIVNFIHHVPLGEKVPKHTVELFDEDGTLLGYGPLQIDDTVLNGNARVKNSIEVLWKDAADRVYLRRRNERGFFVLSVAKLVISEM